MKVVSQVDVPAMRTVLLLCLMLISNKASCLHLRHEHNLPQEEQQQQLHQPHVRPHSQRYLQVKPSEDWKKVLHLLNIRGKRGVADFHPLIHDMYASSFYRYPFLHQPQIPESHDFVGGSSLPWDQIDDERDLDFMTNFKYGYDKKAGKVGGGRRATGSSGWPVMMSSANRGPKYGLDVEHDLVHEGPADTEHEVMGDMHDLVDEDISSFYRYPFLFAPRRFVEADGHNNDDPVFEDAIWPVGADLAKRDEVKKNDEARGPNDQNKKSKNDQVFSNTFPYFDLASPTSMRLY